MTENNNNIDDNPVEEFIKNFKRCLIDVNDEVVEGIVDSGSKCPIITYEVAKKFGFIKDKSLPNVINEVVYDIVKQVSGKKNLDLSSPITGDSETEIQQDIINSITNSDISRRNHTPSEVKRKKRFLNNTASESSSSSSSSSGFDSESSSYEAKTIVPQ
ncbi:16565_t:CDS:2 [Acaulospora colombiana]|uniref:16565_t:CDS:1 n=1 Tax=Acaulospora colombiana TaxID=27376 RepID=A0ACA9MB73_9GLOM|nr:16565_t:CDS:2 [Acaulospora colombiana]